MSEKEWQELMNREGGLEFKYLDPIRYTPQQRAYIVKKNLAAFRAMSKAKAVLIGMPMTLGQAIYLQHMDGSRSPLEPS